MTFIINTCQNYTNAYQELAYYRHNTSAQNALYLTCTASYCLVVPYAFAQLTLLFSKFIDSLRGRQLPFPKPVVYGGSMQYASPTRNNVSRRVATSWNQVLPKQQVRVYAPINLGRFRNPQPSYTSHTRYSYQVAPNIRHSLNVTIRFPAPNKIPVIPMPVAKPVTQPEIVEIIEPKVNKPVVMPTVEDIVYNAPAEQPKVVNETVNVPVKEQTISLEAIELASKRLPETKTVQITPLHVNQQTAILDTLPAPKVADLKEGAKQVADALNDLLEIDNIESVANKS